MMVIIMMYITVDILLLLYMEIPLVINNHVMHAHGIWINQ